MMMMMMMIIFRLQILLNIYMWDRTSDNLMTVSKIGYLGLSEEFFEPVFPFSRFPVVKTPLALTNHRPSTGLREYGQRDFLTPGVKETRKSV